MNYQPKLHMHYFCSVFFWFRFYRAAIHLHMLQNVDPYHQVMTHDPYQIFWGGKIHPTLMVPKTEENPNGIPLRSPGRVVVVLHPEGFASILDAGNSQRLSHDASMRLPT